MTYDFSNHKSQQKPKKKKSGKKRSHKSSKAAQSNSSMPQVPGWAWMLMGLILGVSIAFFYPRNTDSHTDHGLTDEEFALEASHSDDDEPVETNSDSISASDDPEDNDDSSSTISEEQIPTETVSTNFEFYTILSEQEVMVQELQRPSKKKNKPKTANSKNDTKPRAISSGQYTLQAGSFQRAEDANKLAVRIKSKGLTVKVEQGVVQRNDVSTTWHRVMVGPYSDSDNIFKAEKALEDLGIKSLLMKRR